jgi:hypothetical protein
MEEAVENGKELLHSAHVNGVIWMNGAMIIQPLVIQQSASFVTAIHHAVYSFVVCANQHLRLLKRPKNLQPFEHAAPAVLPISHKKQKNAGRK